MWLKLLLLTLYLIFLFILSRILETASWYQDTGSFLSSFVALDPITLSVKKLKEILDSRGVSYIGVVEKQELMELVESSGMPSNEELESGESEAEDTPETTKFTCGSHFYEEVEDTKDSAWLVQVIMDDDDSPLLSENTWNEVVLKVAKFGVRTGIFKCSLDKKLCRRKNWTSSRLILGLPRGNKAKEDVILHNYAQPSNTFYVLQWVRKHLATHVNTISSEEELKSWMKPSDTARNSEIKVIFISTLKSCPIFLSALSIKFNGRVKFATVDVANANFYKKPVTDSPLPIYLIVTPEKTFHYGLRRGECYNYRCMELFLRTFIPEMNDVFLWTLLLINALASFELFFMYSQVWKHFLFYVVCVVKYNSLLFLSWLLILALYQFPVMLTCTDALLKCLRFISGSNVASVLRSDYKNFYSYTFLLVTFIVFASVAGFLLKKLKWVQEEDSYLFSNWWFVPRDSFVTAYFFRPMASLTRPATSQELDLEVGMELLIERLAVPNLWLQPVISMDYIKDLPVWKYQGWCEADDANEESKNSTLLYSDDESANASSFQNNIETPVPNSQTSSFDNRCLIETAAASDVNNKSSQKESIPESDTIVQCSNSSLQTLPLSSNLSEAPNRVPDIDRAPKGMLEFRECSICLENYCYAEILCGLPCGHNFHMNCIMLWLARDNHCCPICRWPSYKPKFRLPHLHFQ
ncbi:E3 ubiquitin-protein ligase RNF103-like [Uloborus diversus]|uniref:E3 ubiquitin-protein ligase RNF103-like n=1 Tax=Uloborus diversus TaxID=327109 RepID=UPI002409F42C|nr:E3 ubiquitin-protein ligase RNF103-like [Uloborus diversus]